jgi:DNA mismatch repair protein MutS2
MDAHTLQVLEYAKIKAMLRRYLLTPLGVQLLERLQPDNNLTYIRRQMRLTTEARMVVDRLMEPPLDPVHDLHDLLSRITPQGSYLDPREMLLMRDTLKTMGRAAAFCKELDHQTPLLRQWGQDLQPLHETVQAIGKVISEEAVVKDSASRELKNVRRSIHSLQEQITRRLNRIMRRSGTSDYLQETYFTRREGRYVLPVQSKFKARVKGIVHDCSDTGTTTFIEPAEIVDDGNRLRELYTEEEVEVRRILRQLTTQIKVVEEPIRWNLDILGRLDFTFAKGRFSAAFDMIEPELASKGELRIRSGLHPVLLDKLGADKVVPLSLDLGHDYSVLVITGPNTGGKTVVLKTAGILCLMAASGLHLPADSHSRIVLYDNIFADIGDEQSIEQSLSTFSSHINQIGRFVQECGENTLVLLDELGAGTDPVEGGALGVAILQRLHQRRAHVMVTTHLNELKVFAYESQGVENAGMEFDRRSLNPTYRLLPGSPGSSYALDIASRLGLPGELVDHARSRLERREESPEALLERLANDRRRAGELLEQARREEQRAEGLRVELAQRLDRVEKEKGQVLEQTRHQARSRLEELQESIRKAEEDLETLLQLARQAGEDESLAARESIEEIKQKQMALRLEAKKKFQPPKERPEAVPIDPNSLAPGQNVLVKGFSTPGEILSLDEKRRQAEVSIQSVLVRIPLNRISGIVKVKPAEPPKTDIVISSQVNKTDDLPRSIDIHGMTKDEAFPVLEQYLDRAHLAGWEQVYIIHGHGTGVLRQMVHQMMRKHPLVSSFRPGDYFEGGTGVTVAKMHKRH